MSYTQEDIYAFSAYVQCKLATIGANIANKLVYKDICIEEKLSFILANTYLKIIRNYNNDSCVDDERFCTMVSFLRKYLNETSYHNNNCNC